MLSTPQNKSIRMFVCWLPLPKSKASYLRSNQTKIDLRTTFSQFFVNIVEMGRIIFLTQGS